MGLLESTQVPKCEGGVHVSPRQGNTEKNKLIYLLWHPRNISESPINKSMILGCRRKEARVSEENPRMHGKNIQTPHEKDPNQMISCCEATVLTSTPQ